MAYQYIFERFEIKYIINQEQRKNFEGNGALYGTRPVWTNYN